MCEFANAMFLFQMSASGTFQKVFFQIWEIMHNCDADSSVDKLCA